MNLRNKLQLSLQSRFSLAIILSVVSFVVIALIFLGSFVQIRSNIRQVVGVQLEQTVDSSRLTRELSQILSRLNVLQARFYGDDEYLLQEGAVLQKMLVHHSHSHTDVLLELHAPLNEKLTEYITQCGRVNDLLRLLRNRNEGMDKVFVALSEHIASQRQATEMLGTKIDHLELLSLSVDGFRVAFQEIVQLSAWANPQGFFNVEVAAPLSNSELVSNLKLKLEAITDADSSIGPFGRDLIDQLHAYQQLTVLFQQEMIHLGDLSEGLSRLTDEILSKMGVLDWQNEQLAERTEQQLDKTLLTTGIVVLALMLVLALLMGLIQLNLFSHHIKRPMEKVRKRLLSFQRGDHTSPMALGRSDEWGQIETIFNNMLGDLVESWSALQESERRYRNIFDSAAFGIFQSTPEGVLLNINPALAVMFGASIEDDVSSMQDLGGMLYVDPQDRKRMMERLQREETVSGYEVQLRRLTGEVFWASITAHVVVGKDDKMRLIEGTIDDISTRRQAEGELHRLKEYLHDIVDTMPSILVGVDEDLKISIWNQHVVDVSGITASQAVGKPLEEVFGLVSESDYLEIVREILARKEVARLRKVSGINTVAGHFFDLLIYPLTTLDATGVVIHMDDVTEKAQIEEVMVQSEKMLSVGSLAAGMAHEINNPLAAVLQNVQVMDQRLSPALKKNQQVAEKLGISIEQVAEYAEQRGFKQMIKSISDAGQRAARIIENMLNFSRKSTSNFIPCSLSELAEKTIELAGSDYDMKHHFDFRAINVVRDYQPVPDVPCESSQIQQVILNLLKNAAQALGNKTEQPVITVRVFSQGDQACLQIEDNGEGMDEKTRRRIFEPFFTTKEVGSGTGLGLSVSYFLITENHKGHLMVTSEQGKGTCFSILLPLER